MGFLQDAPKLAHTYRNDRVLHAYLGRALPGDRFDALEPDLDALGDYATMAWHRREMTPRTEPVLTQWDAWGRRVDRIALTPAWEEGPGITTRHGLLAAGHADSPYARIEQFARVYLYHVASEFYTCPLAMTDGAATALKASGNRALTERALPHFLSRDPADFWLSGQWMTETRGGSDVANTETIARLDDHGQWRLYGRKWFSSAVIGEAALALARPEGAGPGTSALALFYVETKDERGAWRDITIDRLKHKLGTRELPTAEIHLHGLPATPVGPLDHGVRQITPMLNVTRTWNAVCAIASMSRAIALARDYATKRSAFGARLIDQPLHARTLADLQAEFEGAFALTFFVVELHGRVEQGLAAAHEPALLRLLTPLAKLWTGKMAVRITSEAIECFGGAGYIEDTGLPQLLRDAQIYSIWEGTTNVLSLDTLRALGPAGLQPVRAAIEQLLDNHGTGQERAAIDETFDNVERLLTSLHNDRAGMEACARGVAFTLSRVMAAALLVRAARWAAEHGDPRPAAACRRFLAHGLDRLVVPEGTDDAMLAGDRVASGQRVAKAL
ncbi:alkylation response protein AidB-like acyl-CoA dehydrogenase [Luteibacter rhizovicinus]|uniref:Alkylation response protein AidB-like acyl-CoA dehydrogenase n=1 Tax=Luteibacter rhizovicinus TaxID=242606 RepID=A0A4R3YFF7_9GAMM|nr:acyl-CoA dehydrogenase family protein [Luteibacter rhizovicinus]TCV91285.1 alkylation response protein AidB-like acyl-CoA dehydrogenase [Luteibacter rhizovicinus]